MIGLDLHAHNGVWRNGFARRIQDPTLIHAQGQMSIHKTCFISARLLRGRQHPIEEPSSQSDGDCSVL